VSSMSDLLLLMQGQGPQRFWLPVRAADSAAGVDFAFYFIFYVSLFFFALIVTLMFVFVLRYRRRRPGEAARGGASHNTALELVWSIIPVGLVAVMFWLGFRSYVEMQTIPANAYEINVTAQKWSWLFTYPNGVESDELHVPADTPVRLVMQSKDVIHSLYIPAFRLKRDVVPGRYAEMWFKATRPGTYPLLCAEYCGKSHSDMTTVCVVEQRGQFEKWLESADPIKALTPEQFQEYMADPAAFIEKHRDDPKLAALQTPAMLGERIFTKKGCGQCHSTDGSPHTGPTMLGLFGKRELFTDGSEIAAIDENYIRESILDPGKRVVRGFDNVMPRINVSDREIDMIIAYIKSLKKQ